MTNRSRYQKLLDEYGITQAQSAALICELTQRPCSVRAVRSWLNDPMKPSSRECPSWAVDALERALAARKRLKEGTLVDSKPVIAGF